MVVLDACMPAIDVWTFIGLASVMTLALISFMFMIGRLLVKSEFEAMAKKELSQLFVALIIAISIIGLATASCGATQALVQDTIGEGNQFTASTQYLTTLIYKKGIPTIQNLWVSGFILDMLSSLEINSGLPMAGSSLKFSPGKALVPFSKIVNFFAGFFNVFIGSLHAQLILIQLSEAFAMTIMLPLGMVLRTIPGIRKGGSFLMALAFGLYIVFPMTYVMYYAIYNTIDPNFSGLVQSELKPLETFKMSSQIIDVLKYFDEMAVLIPQATLLALINFTITVSFVEIFTNFLDSIE